MRLEGLGVAALEAGEAVVELEPLFFVEELVVEALNRFLEDAAYPPRVNYTAVGHEVPLLGPGLGELPPSARPFLCRDPIIRLSYALVKGIYRLFYCFRVE